MTLTFLSKSSKLHYWSASAPELNLYTLIFVHLWFHHGPESCIYIYFPETNRHFGEQRKVAGTLWFLCFSGQQRFQDSVCVAHRDVGVTNRHHAWILIICIKFSPSKDSQCHNVTVILFHLRRQIHIENVDKTIFLHLSAKEGVDMTQSLK